MYGAGQGREEGPGPKRHPPPPAAARAFFDKNFLLEGENLELGFYDAGSKNGRRFIPKLAELRLMPPPDYTQGGREVLLFDAEDEKLRTLSETVLHLLGGTGLLTLLHFSALSTVRVHTFCDNAGWRQSISVEYGCSGWLRQTVDGCMALLGGMTDEREQAKRLAELVAERHGGGGVEDFAALMTACEAELTALTRAGNTKVGRCRLTRG